MKSSTLLAGLFALLIVGGACFGAGYFVAKEQFSGAHTTQPVVARGDGLDQPALDDGTPLKAPDKKESPDEDKPDKAENTGDVTPKTESGPGVENVRTPASDKPEDVNVGSSKPSQPDADKPDGEKDITDELGNAIKKLKGIDDLKKMKPEEIEEMFKGKQVDFNASVAGQVFDAGGVPVAGATVYASYSEDYTANDNGRTVRFVTASGDSDRGQPIATTDGSGNFTADIKRKISEKASLRVSLVAGADTYADSKENSVTLKNGDKKEGVKLELRGAGGVTGRVVTAGGMGVEGVTIGLNPVSGGGFGDTMYFDMGGKGKYSATTDVGGNFTIEGIPEGRYKFKLSGSGYRQVSGPTEVDVKTGLVTNASTDFQVAVTSSMGAAFVDAEGKPVRGWATIKFSDDSGKLIKQLQGSISKEGTFEQNDPPAGSFDVEIRVWGYKPYKVRATLLEGQRYDFGSVTLEAEEGVSEGVYFPGSDD